MAASEFGMVANQLASDKKSKIVLDCFAAVS